MVTGNIYLDCNLALLVVKFLKRVELQTKYKVVLVTFRALGGAVVQWAYSSIIKTLTLLL